MEQFAEADSDAQGVTVMATPETEAATGAATLTALVTTAEDGTSTLRVVGHGRRGLQVLEVVSTMDLRREISTLVDCEAADEGDAHVLSLVAANFDTRDGGGAEQRAGEGGGGGAG